MHQTTDDRSNLNALAATRLAMNWRRRLLSSKDGSTAARSPVCVAPPSWGRHPQTFTLAEVGPTRSPRQQGREARAAFAINYDGNPDQDGRPAGPALQVLRLQSWYTPRHSKDGICFKDRQSRYRARQLFMHCCLAVRAANKVGGARSASRALSVPVLTTSE